MKLLLISLIFSYAACKEQCNDSYFQSIATLINKDTLASDKFKRRDIAMKQELLSNLCDKTKLQDKLVIFEQEGNNEYFLRGIVYFVKSKELFSYMVNEKFELRVSKGGQYDKDGLLQKLIESMKVSDFNIQDLQIEGKRKQSHAPTTKLFIIDFDKKANNQLIFL